MGSSKPTPPHKKATVSGLGRGRSSQTLTCSVKQRRPVCRLRLHKCLMSGAGHLPDAEVLRPQRRRQALFVEAHTPRRCSYLPRDKQSDGRPGAAEGSQPHQDIIALSQLGAEAAASRALQRTDIFKRQAPDSLSGSRSHGAAAAFLAGLTRATSSPRGGPHRARLPPRALFPHPASALLRQAHRSPVHIQTCDLHTAPS